MARFTDCQQLRSELTNFTKLNNNLFAYSTAHHGVKIITTPECKVLLSFQNEYLNFDTTAVCFSPNARLIAFATKTHLHIADLASKKIIKSIHTDNEHLKILSFDPTSKYIVAGNDQGRVLLYKYNSNSHLARLCSFPYQKLNKSVKSNFVSSITFYKNLIATSGYGGAIYILDIYSGANRTALLHKTSPKRALYFVDEDTIISGDNDGNLQQISISTDSVLKSIHLPFKKITQIVPIPETDYLAIHAKTNTIAIVDSLNLKIINSSYIKLKDNIAFMDIVNTTTMVVVLTSKKIINIALPDRDKLNSLIMQNSLHEAYKLIEKEPMLQNTKEHDKLKDIYNKTYKNAADALINQNITSANQLMEIYKELKETKESTRLLFKSFNQYNRFKTLFIEKKYALAYAMSAKYPALQLTQQYSYMEERWKETCTNAQRHMIMNKPHYAKSLFQEYVTVSSKRANIELILNHNTLFIKFLKSIETNDLKTLNDLSKQNPLFTKIPIYESIENNIKKSIEIIELCIKNNKLALAKKHLNKIDGAYGFFRDIKHLHKRYDEMEMLQTHYKNSDFYSCYELIDSHPHLCSSELGELLQKHYSKLIDRCEEFASKGNIEGIKAVLGDLITLHYRKDRVGDLLRVSFQIQIKYFLSKKKFRSAQSIIYTYIDIFTKDTEIESLMKKYETLSQKTLAITQNESDELSRDSWLKSILLSD